jgi:hypothetical protein
VNPRDNHPSCPFIVSLHFSVKKILAKPKKLPQIPVKRFRVVRFELKDFYQTTYLDPTRADPLPKLIIRMTNKFRVSLGSLLEPMKKMISHLIRTPATVESIPLAIKIFT